MPRPSGTTTALRITRFNATLVAYLFLLYFDTRVGAGDTGPYPLADGRVLLVRDYYQLADSDFWWSDVAAAVPYRNLTAALVLDGVRIDRITDFGTTYTTPEAYLDHLVGFGLFTTDGQPPGELRPVPLDELDGHRRRGPPGAVRPVPVRRGMDRHEKIRCGAYVYFSFLRPFAEEAGLADVRLDRAEGHPRPALRAGLGHGGRQRRRGGRRPVLRAAGVTSPWAAADELRHADAGAEEWTFSFWTADGSAGGLVLLRLLPAARTCWYWAALVRAGQPLLHVNDWEAPLPRVGLAVRSEGLWADHVCEAPYEQWTVANETYAVALDDPADALGRAFGISAPMAFDLEWYAASAPTAVGDGYEQQGEVHGVVELGGGALELQAAPAHRTHRWADALAPWSPEPAMAHLGLRAVARVPDGTVVDLVLTADGWRSRVPRSP